jgi:hypothetical protein
MKQPSNKETVKRLYNEYKEQFLNEIYDTPLEFKKDSNTKYIVYDKEENELAYFLFKFMYNINDSPIDYKKYKLDRYWNVDWYWIDKLPKEQKTAQNFIKVTSTAFKIVDDFIISNNFPLLLGFGGLTESHDRIYSNKNFIERWQILFGEKYKVKYHNDKLWIINKIITVDENKISRIAEIYKKSNSEAYRKELFPTKRDVKGISRHDMIKEQIKRIILKCMYLR